MGTILTCLATGLTFCCCTACSSLVGACLGNDKPSTIPPSVTSGRKRSVLLLVLALVLSLVLQYAITPWIVQNSNNQWTGYMAQNWLDGCQYGDAATGGLTWEESCVGNHGVYRVCAAAVLLFILLALVVLGKPTFNREVWPAKYVLYLFLCGVTLLIPNEPVFSDIYLNVARAGGAIFIILQQIIIVDLAYGWNDSWVEKSNHAESEEAGAGRKWLVAILVSVALMFTLALAGIVVLFTQYTGCPTNDAFISVTLVLMVLVTIAQLSGEEGNLLSSAAVSLWAVFLCYTAVSKNPNEACNPFVGETDGIGIFLGLLVTIVSMAWTGWSWTAEEKLSGGRSDLEESLVSPHGTTNATEGGNTSSPSTTNNNDEPRRNVTGVVVAGKPSSDDHNGRDGDDDHNDNNDSPRLLSNSWKLNIMLAAIACWMSMALTSWGEIVIGGVDGDDNRNASNATAGRIGMWIVIASQWLVLTLYLWTLIAPRLFPDRDFS